MTSSREKEIQEKTLKSDTIYEGRIITVRVETVELPDMKYAKREIVDHARGVGMVALNEENEIYLVRQYRIAVKETLLEIPAGLVEPGETPSQAASRELQEEIGQKANSMEYLMDAYASPGFTNEKLSLFLATDLEPSSLPQDDTEFIEVVTLPIEEAYEKVLNLEITDSKTIIGIQYAYHNLQRTE